MNNSPQQFQDPDDPGGPALSIDLEELERAREYMDDFYLFANHRDVAVREIHYQCLLRTAKRMAQGQSFIREPDDTDARVLQDGLTDMFFKGHGTAQDLVTHEVELVSFPDVYFRIKEVLESETSSARDIAEVVSMDTALSAKLLQLVNSPAYGFPSAIDSITRAVTLLGADELSSLAMGVTAASVFKDIPKALVNMKSFWSHSVCCGLAARKLAAAMGGVPKERCFVGGLLHDIGRLIMFKKLPYASAQAVIYSRENGVPLCVAEADVFGFDHALVGGLLLHEWNLPPSLVDMVMYHHHPRGAQARREAALIGVADNMVVALEIADGKPHVLPGLDQGDWEELNLTTDVIETAMREASSQTEAIVSAFTS